MLKNLVWQSLRCRVLILRFLNMLVASTTIYGPWWQDGPWLLLVGAERLPSKLAVIRSI